MIFPEWRLPTPHMSPSLAEMAPLNDRGHLHHDCPTSPGQNSLGPISPGLICQDPISPGPTFPGHPQSTARTSPPTSMAALGQEPHPPDTAEALAGRYLLRHSSQTPIATRGLSQTMQQCPFLLLTSMTTTSLVPSPILAKHDLYQTTAAHTSQLILKRP